MQVQELVQTTTTIEISPKDIIGILFLFRKDDIVDGLFPCEQGIEITFVLQYRIINGILQVIPEQQCLPFPCSYGIYSLSESFPCQIFKNILKVRQVITKVMCRKGKNLGLGFISASSAVSFTK